MSAGELYCACESPIFDHEHDAGCRRCGRPLDFNPGAGIPEPELDSPLYGPDLYPGRTADELAGRPPAFRLAAPVLVELREHASTLLAEDRAEALAFILGIYDEPQPWPPLGELERRYAEDFDWLDTDDYEAKRDADAASEAVTRVLRSMIAKIDELAGGAA